MKIKKPFDLEKAKSGAEVVTRCGYPYKFLHILHPYSEDPGESKCVLGYYQKPNKDEICLHTYPNGKIRPYEYEDDLDLFILEESERSPIWTNVYKDDDAFLYTSLNFPSKEEGEKYQSYIGKSNYIKTMLLHEE